MRQPLLVDNDPPVIREPTRRALFNEGLWFEPVVSDASGQVRVDLLIDGRLRDSDLAAPYYLSWSVYSLRNGSHEITLRATDAVGLRSEISRTIVVDTTPPTVTGLRPAHKSFVRGTFTVRAARVSDAYGVAAVELYVDGKRTGRDTKPPYSFTVKTRQASWFDFYALDRAGNLTSIERHIFVDTRKLKKTMKVQFRAYDKAGNVKTTKARVWHRR